MTKEIPLTRGKITLVDDEDYDQINQFKWCANKCGTKWYALRADHGKFIFMHRFILDLEEKRLQCDHINGDGLDNRRCNLRIVTNSQNKMNQHKIQAHSSSFKGVTWDKSRNKWTVSIALNGKQYHLGRYINEIDAARVYDEAAKRLFGEYARPNFKE